MKCLGRRINGNILIFLKSICLHTSNEDFFILTQFFMSNFLLFEVKDLEFFAIELNVVQKGVSNKGIFNILILY